MGMVLYIYQALAEVPVNFVCFGNHESDVGHAQLSARINEFTHPRSRGMRQVKTAAAAAPAAAEQSIRGSCIVQWFSSNGCVAGRGGKRRRWSKDGGAMASTSLSTSSLSHHHRNGHGVAYFAAFHVGPPRVGARARRGSAEPRDARVRLPTAPRGRLAQHQHAELQVSAPVPHAPL